MRGRPGPRSDTGGRRPPAGGYERPIPDSATASRALAFRGGVGAAARTVGLPYGYTITVWSTAQTTIAEHGTPRVWEIALYALGAVTAYWAARAWAAGTATERDGTHATAHPALRGWLVQAAAVATPVAAAAVLARGPAERGVLAAGGDRDRARLPRGHGPESRDRRPRGGRLRRAAWRTPPDGSRCCRSTRTWLRG